MTKLACMSFHLLSQGLLASSGMNGTAPTATTHKGLQFNTLQIVVYLKKHCTDCSASANTIVALVWSNGCPTISGGRGGRSAFECKHASAPED